MRDDLHKGAPVPFRYRRLILACIRDRPDREERSRERAFDALVGDVRAELSEAFWNRISTQQPQLALGIAVPVPSLAGLKLTPLEGRASQYFARAHCEGSSGYIAAEKAIRSAVEERRDAWVRMIDGHVAVKESARNRAIVMQRIRNAMASVPLNEVCASAWSPRGRAAKEKSPFDVDADIRK